MLLSSIVLGGPFGERSDNVSFQLLDHFIEHGGTVVETAHNYADGESELQIGRWISTRRNRDQILLIDKGCHPDDGLLNRVTPAYFRSDLESSLQRLKTEWIDLYLLHRDDPEQPIAPLLEALTKAQEQGKIRAFGLCNWSTERLQSALECSHHTGLGAPVISSCHFSLALQTKPRWIGARAITRSEQEWHRATQFPLLSWSSLAHGWFSGDYICGRRQDPEISRVYDNIENRARFSRTSVLARNKSITPLQVSLSFVLSQPFPILASIGPETLSELTESLQVSDLRLEPRELEYLEFGV